MTSKMSWMLKFPVPLTMLALPLAAMSLLVGCPQSYTLLPEGRAFTEESDAATPGPASASSLPPDGFCARRIEYDQYSAGSSGVDTIGTVVYDAAGRWVRYGEVSAGGAPRQHHTRVFDGARLLTYDHDVDADGEPEYSNVVEYDDDARVVRFMHTGPDRRSLSVRRWDEEGRLVTYDTDADDDGVLDSRRHYEWGENLITATTTRDSGPTSAVSHLLGADGFVDEVERSQAGEATSYEHFDREGARIHRRSFGADAERVQWVSAYTWREERLVGETHDDLETEGVDQTVAYSYDAAGRPTRRRSTSSTGSYWAATVSFSYDPEGRLSDVVVRDEDNRETWRTFHITTSCPAGFSHHVPVHPVGEYEQWWLAEPQHSVDFEQYEWMNSPFDDG